MSAADPRNHLRYAPPNMTHRASRGLGLAPLTVLFVALACGSSHGGAEEGDGTSGSSGVGVAGKATKPDPPGVGTGGATSPSGGFGNAPTGTGGFGTGGAVSVGGSFSGVGGFTGGVAGVGGFTGGVASGGTGGVQYPPGSCPAMPPPNGSSCASYVVDPDFRCSYDAPACRVVSTCTAGAKWRSACEAPGDGGSPSDGGSPNGEAGAGGAVN
jgi:hypothetical protein